MAVNGSDPKEYDSFWVGYLAGTIEQSLVIDPLDGARCVLERALDNFKRSPACTPNVKQALQRQRKGTGER